MQIANAERCGRHAASLEAVGQPCDTIGSFSAKVTIPWRLPGASPPSMTIMLDRHRAGWRLSARPVPVHQSRSEIGLLCGFQTVHFAGIERYETANTLSALITRSR
jgi:hypothetical protein